MEFIRRNSIWGIIIIIVIGLFLRKDNYLLTHIVSAPDTVIEFSTDDILLTQTWQSHVKEISGIGIKYEVVKEFETLLEMRVLSNDIVLLEEQKTYHFVNGETGTIWFEFEKIKVEPGERYTIELRFKEFSQNGIINLNAGSNYAGCILGENEQEKAAAFEIEFVKASRAWWLFASMLPFISISLLFMIIWDKKFEDVIAVAIIVSSVILYVLGWIEKLNTGRILLYILSIVCLIISCMIYNKNKMTLKQLYSPGLLIYFGLIAVILLNVQSYYFAQWDEYSHWGLAVKDMFYYDSFGKHADTTVTLFRYLPFITLIEYWFVYHNVLFSENVVYAAFQIVMLSGLIPLVKIVKGNLKFLVPVIGTMFCIPIIFFRDVTNCIYVDPLLAIWFAYILFCYFSEEESGFNWLRIFCGLFALTMTKDMGIILAGCAILIILGDVIYSQYENKKINVKKNIVCVGMLLAIVAFFMSWQIYLSIPVQANDRIDVVESEKGEGKESVVSEGAIEASGITVNKLLELVKGEGKEYRYKVIDNYLITIFDGDTYCLGNCTFSYMDLLIVMVIGGGVFLTLLDRDNKKRYIVLGIMVVGAACCYALFLLVTYLFAFSETEALMLASHIRYLASCLAGILIFYFALILIKMTSTSDKKRVDIFLVVMSGLLMICLPVENLIIKNRDIKITEEQKYGYEEIQEIIRSVGRKSEKVYFVCNNSGGAAYQMFKNAACPLLTPYTEYNIFASREAFLKQCSMDAQTEEETKSGKYVTVEELSENLAQCQYMYILHPNDVFAESYGELFEEPEKIGDGTFYQVRKNEDGNVSLHYVGKVGIKGYK